MAMRRKTFLGLLLMLPFLTTPVAYASMELHHSDPAFSLQIPQGFETYDSLAAFEDSTTRRFVEELTLYAFYKGGAPSVRDFTGIRLLVENSYWRLVRGLDLGLSFWNTDFETIGWRSRTIRLLRLERSYTTGGDRLVVLTAVVPVSGGPIQIKLSGDISFESEMRRHLQDILDSLDARPSIFAYLDVLTFGSLIVGAVWVALKLRYRRRDG